jgi:branched-chain amino acid transport system substrate-binding protein
MKATRYDDPLFGDTKVRQDGRVVHAMYLVEVKKPSESKGAYDYFKILANIPADKAFRPLAEEKGTCGLVKTASQWEGRAVIESRATSTASASAANSR